jgi:transposase
MANQLRMAQIWTIRALWQQGWSGRRIARQLGLDRGTVSKYIEQFKAEQSKPANVTPGKSADWGPNSAVSASEEASKPATQVTPGSSGAKSKCTPFHEVILAKLEAGLSAQRIYQDLIEEQNFSASYQSVKRYVRKLGRASPLPFRRMECGPAEEVQVDFGKGALVRKENGSWRRPWLFRIVLSHSRKAYSEVVWKQTTENFIRCLENAFWAFGGVPATVVLDNLKAAVTKADWFDPELNPKIEAFARHYGTAFLPTKPYTPRHKGKVERGVGYAQSNALKARRFGSLHEQNEFLIDWERSIADLRIHGTTRKQVRQHFEEVEREALKPLPAERFPFFHEGQRTAHRDAHVEVQKAYYSVPPEYMARTVWVRYDTRVVRIFNLRMELIAAHARMDPGRFSTHEAHIASEKISRVEKGASYLLSRAHLIGDKTALWAKAVMEERGVQGIRVVHGLLSLTKNHRYNEIEKACELALGHGAYRLRAVRRLLAEPTRQENFEFMQKHPLIRDLEDYGRYLQVRFGKEEA